MIYVERQQIRVRQVDALQRPAVRSVEGPQGRRPVEDAGQAYLTSRGITVEFVGIPNFTRAMQAN